MFLIHLDQSKILSFGEGFIILHLTLNYQMVTFQTCQFWQHWAHNSVGNVLELRTGGHWLYLPLGQSWKGYKTLWEKEKLLVMSNFSFSDCVFQATGCCLTKSLLKQWKTMRGEWILSQSLNDYHQSKERNLAWPGIESATSCSQVLQD